ncbi:hypothetical protein BCEN4_1230031 [Burkholderia cenocepacia]|nr:hypothetical protein BCEN4_1230031 [Burkholderia cenocepacia]
MAKIGLHASKTGILSHPYFNPALNTPNSIQWKFRLISRRNLSNKSLFKPSTLRMTQDNQFDNQSKFTM